MSPCFLDEARQLVIVCYIVLMMRADEWQVCMVKCQGCPGVAEDQGGHRWTRRSRSTRRLVAPRWRWGLGRLGLSQWEWWQRGAEGKKGPMGMRCSRRTGSPWHNWGDDWPRWSRREPGRAYRLTDHGGAEGALSQGGADGSEGWGGVRSSEAWGGAGAEGFMHQGGADDWEAQGGSEQHVGNTGGATGLKGDSRGKAEELDGFARGGESWEWEAELDHPWRKNLGVGQRRRLGTGLTQWPRRPLGTGLNQQWQKLLWTRRDQSGNKACMYQGIRV